MVVAGQTASGKSALALELAKRLDGELICADSWTVYPGFDIGTAKPSPEERRQVRHHLLDVADPVSGFSAPQFQKLANQAIADITGRGKLPIMVGGTGLYIDSIIYNYSFLPPSDPSLRQELNNLSLKELIVKTDNMKLDLSGIDQRNKRRVIRLIENKGKQPLRSNLRSNTLVLGIRLSKEQLRLNVAKRVKLMIDEGLEQEVRRLAAFYGWDVEPMKGIGYKEFKGYLNDQQNLEETRHQISKNTLGLAKRQATWFKRNNSIHWLNNRDDINKIVDIVTTKLNK